MTPIQTSILLSFAIIYYLVLTDKSIAAFIMLMFKSFGVNVRRYFWIIQYHPKNPITNYIQKKKYSKIAEELIKEYESK